MAEREVYYDVETQLSAQEVGGWQNVHLMRIAVAVSWSAAEGFRVWNEGAAPQLIEHLNTFDRVVSFNGDGFDSKVLSRYGDVSTIHQKSFDLLTDLKVRLGHRVTLDSLAQATLGVGKQADGLQSLRWWKEGKVDEIVQYCTQDVQVLVDLTAFGRTKGFVLFTDRFGEMRRVAVRW